MAYVNAIARTSGAFFTCSFAFLILEQNYLCSFNGGQDYATCSVESICQAREDPASTMLYKVDENYDYFMKNWYTEMDLMCVPVTSIAMMYS